MSRLAYLIAFGLVPLAIALYWNRCVRDQASQQTARADAVRQAARPATEAGDSKSRDAVTDERTAGVEPFEQPTVGSTADQPTVAQEPAEQPAPADELGQNAPPAPPEEPGLASKLVPIPELDWLSDYAEGVRLAKKEGRNLFLYFHEGPDNVARRAFETKTLADLEVKEKLADYILVDLDRRAVTDLGDKSIVLMDHPAFAEMLGRQGIAIVDLSHPTAPYYGYVVSTFPFTRGKYYRAQALSIILDLPSGTLTQRTMIYAVRTHPEHPASTTGKFHAVLADEANRHSVYQASITLQGHHSWDSRFQRINAHLPGGTTAQEVVAESWPNEGLVEACVDCVHSWRQSPGHWGAVRSRHPLFGYDIKRGRNGIWYATGIFGRR